MSYSADDPVLFALDLNLASLPDRGLISPRPHLYLVRNALKLDVLLVNLQSLLLELRLKVPDNAVRSRIVPDDGVTQRLARLA